jgi:hypothetical protein
LEKFMKSAWIPAAVSLALTALATAPASSQTPSPTGDVYGTVVDEQDQPVRAAAISLAGPDANRIAETDTNGDFHFKDLSPADYALSIERTGFEAVHRTLTVTPAHNSVVRIVLPVAGEAESVTVSGEMPGVDSRKTRTGATFGQKELQTIPTTRDPWAVLRQVPGVLVSDVNVNGSSAGTQPEFVGKGSHQDQNNYDLDGVTISLGGVTPVFFDFDSFASIDVATGGSDPSLSTPGVTLNLVTRRGTNDVKGSARGLYASAAGWDYGFEAGGPVWKDRLWLWGSYARTDVPGQTFFTAGTNEPVRLTPRLEYWNAKLNAQPAPATSVTGSFLDSDRAVDGRGAGPSRSQPSTWDNTFRTQTYRGEVSQVFSAQMFASAYGSGLQFAFENLPKGGLDEQADNVNGVWRNSFVYRTVDGTQQQAGATASAFFDTGNLRHELKFGFGYRHTSTDSLSTWPGDQLWGSIADDDAIDAQAAVTRAQVVNYEINFYNAYVGDTIQLDRLTLSLGARFDYQQGKNLPSAVPANPVFPDLLPAVSYGGDASYPITWRLVQPRLGATYALGRDRATLLRASYSRFANLLGSEVTGINPFPGVAARYYHWTDLNGNHRVEPSEVDLGDPQGWENVDPDHPGAAVPLNRISPDFKPPTTDEFIVGVERSLTPELTASLAYTHRSARNPSFSPLIGVTRGDYVLGGFASGVASGNGLVLPFREPYYALTLASPPVGSELQNRPDFSETYDGVELQVLKRFSNGWMLRASGAYNDWRQRVGAGAIVDPNNLVGGTNRSGPVVEQTIAGQTADPVYVNARWQFDVSGVATLPFGLIAAANLFGREGFPVLYSVDVDQVGPNESSETLQIGSVAAYRLAPVLDLDLHLERSLALVRGVTITALFDCFNAADSRTVLVRHGRVGEFDPSTATLEPDDQFNDPVQALSARSFRGGIRIAF